MIRAPKRQRRPATRTAVAGRRGDQREHTAPQQPGSRTPPCPRGSARIRDLQITRL